MFDVQDGSADFRPKGPALVLHAGGSWFASLTGQASPGSDFVNKLGQKARAEGHHPILLRAKTAQSQAWLTRPDARHLWLGPRGPVGPGIWHCQPSYLRGFWYCDPQGVNHASSLFTAEFDPSRIDFDKARWFFNGVRGWHLGQNQSKLPQEPRRAAPLPAAKAVIYLQEIANLPRPIHWLDSEEMITTTAKACGQARLYVKLHPRQSPQTRARIESLVAALPGAEISTASIHDLTAASDLVITQNSAAGFEALLQRKPVITCARCDYHHATISAPSPQALTRAIASAAERMEGFSYGKYLYWFLGKHMLEPRSDDFANHIWARLTKV